MDLITTVSSFCLAVAVSTILTVLMMSIGALVSEPSSIPKNVPVILANVVCDFLTVAITITLFWWASSFLTTIHASIRTTFAGALTTYFGYFAVICLDILIASGLGAGALSFGMGWASGHEDWFPQMYYYWRVFWGLGVYGDIIEPNKFSLFLIMHTASIPTILFVSIIISYKLLPSRWAAVPINISYMLYFVSLLMTVAILCYLLFGKLWFIYFGVGVFLLIIALSILKYIRRVFLILKKGPQHG